MHPGARAQPFDCADSPAQTAPDSYAARIPTAGKELIENLTVLRFSNSVFEPLWSRQHIRNVQVGRGVGVFPGAGDRYHWM